LFVNEVKVKVKVTLPIYSYGKLRHPMMYSHKIFGDPCWFGEDDYAPDKDLFAIEVKGQD